MRAGSFENLEGGVEKCSVRDDSTSGESPRGGSEASLWFGWSLLVTLLTISNRVVAVVVALVATPLLMFGAAKDWVRMDD